MANNLTDRAATAAAGSDALFPVEVSLCLLYTSVLEGACDLRAFSSGDALSLAGMQVHAFRTSHDAASSCGFRVEADGDAVGFMTDTGIVTGEADEALRDVRILALESNHDVQMLKDGPYPYPVKRRVGSDTGHLSNVQAADELEALLSDALEQVVAMHISQNNNTYRLPGEDVYKRQIHPRMIQELLEIIDENLGNTGMIVTSHSPYLIQYLKPRCLYVGVPNEEGIASFKKVRDQAMPSLMKAARERGFGFGEYLFSLMSSDEDGALVLSSYLED